MEVRKVKPPAPKLDSRVGASPSKAKTKTQEAPPTPEDRVNLTSDSKAKTSSPDEGLLSPKAGIKYQANQSQARPISLSFDDRAIAFFQNGGLKLDLEQAQVVTKDGRRVPLDHRVGSQVSPRDQHAVEAGYKLPATAEPWQFRVPGIPTQVFGKPHGVHIVGADQGFSMKFVDSEGALIDRETAATELDDFQGMRVDKQVFRTTRQSTLGSLASHVPSPETGGPASLQFVDSEISNVTFRSPSQEALNTAKTSFQKLLGPIVEERAENIDLEKLSVYEAQVEKIITAELESGKDVDQFESMQKAMNNPTALQAMRDIYGDGAEALGNDELLDQVGQKLMKSCPLEITVMPRDKAAIDCVKIERESAVEYLKRAGRAYFMRVNPFAYRSETGSEGLPTQRIFVGEEILETELGVNAVLMHEMLHVFEHIYATPEETQMIEKGYQGATEFQSLYGVNRDEYFTTVGEEFLGTHGPGGQEWVKREHPPVYNLLSGLLDSDVQT